MDSRRNELVGLFLSLRDRDTSILNNLFTLLSRNASYEVCRAVGSALPEMTLLSDSARDPTLWRLYYDKTPEKEDRVNLLVSGYLAITATKWCGTMSDYKYEDRDWVVDITLHYAKLKGYTAWYREAKPFLDAK